MKNKMVSALFVNLTKWDQSGKNDERKIDD
jgi:hypothetical protein